MARQKRVQEEEVKPVIPASPTLFGEPISEMDDEELEEMASEPDETDIFVDVGQALTEKGDRITYTIKKDGEFIAGSVKHPFSWDMLQKKYGGGSYQVIARSTLKKGYVKSESRHVAAPEVEDVHGEPEASKGSSTTDLLMLLQAQKREEREEMLRAEEKRERERQEREEKMEQERRDREAQMKAAGDNTMLMMMKMMEASSAQTTALLTAMIQSQNTRKEPEMSPEKIINMMENRMEKIIALVQGKDKTKDIDALKLMELTADAEDRGYNRAMKSVEMAEKKAEELAEMRADAGAPPAKDEGSTTKMLIDAAIPALQTIMAARGGIPAAAPMIAPGPAVDPHKPAVPRLPMARPSVGLPRAPMPFARASQPKKEEPMSDKQKIERVVIQEIGKDLSANLLTQKFDPEGTADKCLKILEPIGISPETLCSMYDLNAMLVIAKANGMPEAIKPYIERFHAHIKAKTTVGAGKPAESSEPGNR